MHQMPFICNKICQICDYLRSNSRADKARRAGRGNSAGLPIRFSGSRKLGMGTLRVKNVAIVIIPQSAFRPPNRARSRTRAAEQPCVPAGCASRDLQSRGYLDQASRAKSEVRWKPRPKRRGPRENATLPRAERSSEWRGVWDRVNQFPRKPPRIMHHDQDSFVTCRARNQM
jgi:hypothetical protein